MSKGGIIACLSAAIALASCCLQAVEGLEETIPSADGGADAGIPPGCRPTDTGAGVTTLVGGPDSQVSFIVITGVALDSRGNVYASDWSNDYVDRIDCTGKVSLVAEGLGGIAGIAADAAGNVFVADSQFGRIRKVDPAGEVTTIAGAGLAGWADGSGGPDGVAEFDRPSGVAVDASGDVFVADTGNNRIRKIDPSGNVTTLAGNGNAGFADGTGGPMGTAEFSGPVSVAVDGRGNVYVADTGNASIRKVDPGGAVITLAGHPDSSLPAGVMDGTGGPAGTARFVQPWAIAVDASGNAYVADYGGNRVRKIDASGYVTTLAGNGIKGDVNGTLGPSGTAEFGGPVGVAVDASGRVYVADFGNHGVRVITP